MQKGGSNALKSSAPQQMKPQIPKHNMTVIELQTPHQKLPGVQKFTAEDLKLMVEKAKQFPQVHNGIYLKIQNYEFQVDEWELETGNSQPHTDESKMNIRPKTAVTAEQRRVELAKKSQQARKQMDDKFEKERNPTFKRPTTATVKKSDNKKQANQDDEEEEKQNNIVENEPEVNSEHEEIEENEEQNGENEGQNQENDLQDDDEQEDNNKKSKQVSTRSLEENPKSKKQLAFSAQQKGDAKVQGKSKQKEVEEQEEDENNDSYRIQMISKEKQREQQQKQKYKKNLQKEDIMYDGEDEEELNNSFEKLSVSQALNQSNASQASKSKQKQLAKPKGPYKSDVANMMSSMFSEISGFDTDI